MYNKIFQNSNSNNNSINNHRSRSNNSSKLTNKTTCNRELVTCSSFKSNKESKSKLNNCQTCRRRNKVLLFKRSSNSWECHSNNKPRCHNSLNSRCNSSSSSSCKDKFQLNNNRLRMCLSLYRTKVPNYKSTSKSLCKTQLEWLNHRTSKVMPLKASNSWWCKINKNKCKWWDSSNRCHKHQFKSLFLKNLSTHYKLKSNKIMLNRSKQCRTKALWINQKLKCQKNQLLSNLWWSNSRFKHFHILPRHKHRLKSSNRWTQISYKIKVSNNSTSNSNITNISTKKVLTCKKHLFKKKSKLQMKTLKKIKRKKSRQIHFSNKFRWWMVNQFRTKTK